MTIQQSELLEIKEFIRERFDKQNEKINERFDKQDEKINERFNKQDEKINQLIQKQDEKINELKIDLAKIKVDTIWIKWLFGGLLSAILILLSLILTTLFKLIP